MPRLAKLRNELKPGFTSLIWSSLTIDAFIQQAEKVRPSPAENSRETVFIIPINPCKAVKAGV